MEDVHVRRRPLTSRSPNGSSHANLHLHAQPLLRPSKSATQLRKDEAPAGSVIDQLSPPHLPLALRQGELRKAQSSSTLSLAALDNDKPEEPSGWRAALGEARYLAGSLVSRPAESTRHCTVIRHSNALVWYRGPSTAACISILSDEPLPGSRRIWLQARGFSGGLGMAARALVGSTGSWLDVTPARQAQPEDLPEVDERGIQRDLRRFAAKASGRLRAHVPRETHVVRIPAAAADGYFRLVVGAGDDGKNMLCGSPVFRVASTSANAAVVRGASLGTMPLEVGVKIASVIGNQVANRYVGLAGAAVQGGASHVVKSTAARRAAQAAYRKCVRDGLADSVHESWRNNRLQRYGRPVDDGLLASPVVVIGSDTGPGAPFPIRFEGKVTRASGMSLAELGVPTANLRHVPDEIKVRLSGVFAAWVVILPAKGLEISHDWHEAVVSIAPPRGAPPAVAMANAVAVHIAYDFDGATFFDATLRVLLMGYLRPPAATDDPKQHARDVATTLASLARESWQLREAAACMEATRSGRSFAERVSGAAGTVQRQVDRLPLHWAGVRSESAALRDQMYGNGGLWIAR